MKTYLTYKNQIQGLNDVLGTIKVVEKIAASSIHFLKQRVADLNLYTSNLEGILERFMAFGAREKSYLLEEWSGGQKLLLVFTAEKGLVGGLWHALINVSLKQTGNYKSIVVIGVKGERYLEEEGVEPVKSFSQVDGNIISEEFLKNVTAYVFNEFKNKRLSAIDVLYPKFISLAEQRPEIVRFLPFKFSLPAKETAGKADVQSSGLPIFEPSRNKFFSEMLENYVKVSFAEIALETKLSELSARTVAMEDAAAKTEKLIKKTTLGYSKERRESETQKQLESFSAHKIL